MSEAEAVDINSKTSLLKRAWELFLFDAAKMKSITPWISAAAMVWYVIYPNVLAPMAVGDKTAELANVQEQLSQAHDAVAHWKGTAEHNKTANTALTQENAQLHLKLDEALAAKKPESAAPGPAAAQENAQLHLKLDEALAAKKPESAAPGPAAAQEAALEPPLLKTKVRRVPVRKKEEPSTCDQIEACKAFVAWYEKNVSASPVAP